MKYVRITIPKIAYRAVLWITNNIRSIQTFIKAAYFYLFTDFKSQGFNWLALQNIEPEHANTLMNIITRIISTITDRGYMPYTLIW